MREIKFRVLLWNPYENKYGLYEYDLAELIRTTLHPQFIKTVYRYTGLKDKTGKEIYEGDIITDNQSLNPSKGIVKFIKGKFGIYHDRNSWHGASIHTYTDFGVPEGYVIIGNIYENPELLKDKNEKE